MSDSNKFSWGSEDTKFFFELTPDHVLDAVEASGIRCTGRCMAMNSMENRVYDVEIELDEGVEVKSPSDRFRVVKFYRPGRWSEEQILEEHEFLLNLRDAEIPVIAPLHFSDGRTLHQESKSGIWYALFPKKGGRAPDELDDEQLTRVGRLLARIHSVGLAKSAKHRISIGPETYGLQSLEFLLGAKLIPAHHEKRFESVVRLICGETSDWFKEDLAKDAQRIHGDCHLGNLLWTDKGPFFLDFDDMVLGPCVQDLWLLVPGRDEYARKKLEKVLEGYEQMKSFNRRSLRLIEPLRALRMIHFTAWISKRWDDPAFPAAFPQFGTERYWQEHVNDLEEQLRIIREGQ